MEFVMMDKKPHIKPYLYGMLAGFGAIALSIIFFFLIYRFDGFGSAISTLTGILMPFIYGAVIAYLLKPVCNTIEAFLRRFIPEKMKGLINALSVTFTILFGLLLIYATAADRICLNDHPSSISIFHNHSGRIRMCIF